MQPRDTIVVRLTLALLARGELALARAARPERGDLRRVRRVLACGRRERAFARALLERRTNLWLLRTSQDAFGGDFLLVDASAPRADRRRVLVLELKRGERVRRVARERHQLRNARAAVVAFARATGAILEDAPFDAVIGDPDALLVALRAAPGRRAPRAVPLRDVGAGAAVRGRR